MHTLKKTLHLQAVIQTKDAVKVFTLDSGINWGIFYQCKKVDFC